MTLPREESRVRVFEFGNTMPPPEWELNEPMATGYSRVYYITEGDLRYEDEYESCAIDHDTLYVLPSSIPYRVKKTTDRRFACMFLHIDFSPISVVRLTRLPASPDSMLAHYVRTLQLAIADRRRDVVRSLCQAMPAFLDTDPSFRRPSEEMAEILSYIEQHLDEKIDIELLSQRVGYHPNYFYSFFKNTMRITPHQYIIKRRILRAQILLHSDCPIGQVAASVGLSDAASFTRLFKSITGKTPTQYAKSAHMIP